MYLAIETSSVVSSVALMDDKKRIRGELTIQAGLTHSEQLVPHIDILLEQARIKKSDLKAVVVSIGPGSFTGLRIGLATAKAISYGLAIPLVGVMTMDGLAQNVPFCDAIISVMIDGQKKNVYEARYEAHNGVVTCIQPPMVKSRIDALAELAQLHYPVCFLGDGATMAAAQIMEYSEDFYMAPPQLVIPRASSLVLAAWDTLMDGHFVEADSIVPYYIRRSEAEVMWEARHGVQSSAEAPTLTKIVTNPKGEITKEEGHS